MKDLQRELKEKGIDFAVFINSSFAKQEPNFFYFTHMDLERGILAVHNDKGSAIFAPEFEVGRVRKEASVKRVIAVRKGKLFRQIKRIMGKAKAVGINKDMISLNEFKAMRREFKKAKFKDISKICSKVRMVKTKEEIKTIKKSCMIASKIMERCIKNFRRFRSEKESARFLEDEARKEGCEMAFKPIVASGRNSGMPHATPTARMNKGFCIIDFGVKHKGYCSDITRTIYLGKPIKKEIEDYDKVFDVQQECIKKIKAGGKCSEMYEYAFNRLGKRFTHGLGHGIGVEIHELPNLSQKSKDKFGEGMIFTIEPAIYLKNYGIRIEDDVMIEKGKVRVLSNVGRKLVTI